MTEDEMVGWHHRLNGSGFEQTLGDSEGRAARHATVHGVVSNSLLPHGLYSSGILQARILEWVAVPFSRGSSQPRG